MGVLQWLKGIDQRFIDESKDRAANFAGRAGEAYTARQGQLAHNIASGQVTAEQLGPELLHHLRQQAMGRQAPADVMNARSWLTSMVDVPADGTNASKQALIQQLLDAGIAGAEEDRPTWLRGAGANAGLVQGIANLQAAANPSLTQRTMGVLQGMNQQFSTNPWARAGAYASLSGPAGVGAIGLTEAGQGLLELAGILESEDQADQAEIDRQGQRSPQRMG
jgi:hypothetical protein